MQEISLQSSQGPVKVKVAVVKITLNLPLEKGDLFIFPVSKKGDEGGFSDRVNVRSNSIQ